MSNKSKNIIQWAKSLFCPPKKNNKKASHVVIARSHHTVSRAHINPNALKVLYRLKDAGYAAFLVGGSVRDILLDRKPKDFDVATNAHPEAIRNLFRNSRIIGRRFRLVHVFYQEDIIEVSTFRANTIEETRVQSNQSSAATTGMIFRDNTFGTIEEDAWRRDFTVNALYYNITDFSVIDYTNGMHDLKHRLIRMIGDPAQRYHEDPVRLLRAIRFSAKLNFNLEVKTESALKSLSHLLRHVSSSRLFDESLKLFFEGNAWSTYQKLLHYDFLKVLFPQTMSALHAHPDSSHEKLIRLAMQATDTRVHAKESTNPGFLLAVLLWPVLQSNWAKVKNKRDKFFMQLHQVVDDVIKIQLEAIMVPRRFQYIIEAIWIMQFQLEKRRPKRILTLLNHRYFRASFDFMALRVEAGEITPAIFNWWQTFQLADADTQQNMIDAL